MKALRLAGRFFFSRLTIKLLTVVMFFLLIFPPFKPVVDGLVKIVLVWGGIQLVADLLTRRNCLRARHAVWLILLLAVQAITILLNYTAGFKENLSNLCYTALGMLVLYPNDEGQSRENLLREIWVVSWVYIAFCAVGSLLSLGMLIADYSATFEYGGVLYYIGLERGRLFGVFSNPNLPASAIALAVCCLQVLLCRDIAKKRWALPVQYTLLGICAFLNLLYLMLSQSRGSLIAFAAFLLVFLFFLFRKTIFSRLKSLALSSTVSLAVSAAVLAAAVFAYPVAMQAGDQLMILYQQQREQAAESESPALSAKANLISLSRTNSTTSFPRSVGMPAGVNGRLQANRLSIIIRPENEEDFTTGRVELWKQGIERFLEKPVWGYGNTGSLEGVMQDSGQALHFHSLFIHSLAAGGAMGTAALGIVLCAMVLSMGRFIWKNRRATGFRNGYLYVLIALFALYMVNNLVEVYLIYRVSLPHFIFWIYMGYLLSLISQGVPRTRVDGFLCRLADRFPALGRKRETRPEN